jgi:hypothetical protein
MHHSHPSRSALRILLVGALALAAYTTSVQAADDKAAPPAAQGEELALATIAVPSGLTAAQVQQVVVRALVGRRWVIQDKTENKVVAHHAQGRNAATLTITSDDKVIDIRGTGVSRKGGFPTRWVDILKKDLGVFLGQELGRK